MQEVTYGELLLEQAVLQNQKLDVICSLELCIAVALGAILGAVIFRHLRK